MAQAPRKRSGRRWSNSVSIVVNILVAMVVVVVQTRCNDEMFIHDAARDAPIYGGRVPVDTTPGPVPVYRALKNPHSPCAGCLVVITDHGPRAEAARALGHELLVDNGEGRLEGLEEERQNREEKEISGERQQTQHNAQMTMHVWSDARWTT